MQRISLVLEYDGTRYHGWQSQPDGNTVQDIIEQCLARICSGPVRLTGASRTDSGVHALGQVAAFSTSSVRAPDVVKRALNALLPRDIRVLSAQQTHESFHPRYDAQRKTYFYLISLKGNSAFLDRYLWDLRVPLDTDAMAEAGQALLGTHDFRTFQGAGCSARTTIRTIDLLRIERLDRIPFMTAPLNGDFIKIHIGADGFLRHMVRNIVGTLAEFGRAARAAGSMPSLLEQKDRNAAGPTAPAQGLFLEKISY